MSGASQIRIENWMAFRQFGTQETVMEDQGSQQERNGNLEGFRHCSKRREKELPV